MANTLHSRHQKGRQSGDYPGHDEDWYMAYLWAEWKWNSEAHYTNTGHVEKTSDRDYEVEERYDISETGDGGTCMYMVEGAWLTCSRIE